MLRELGSGWNPGTICLESWGAAGIQASCRHAKLLSNSVFTCEVSGGPFHMEEIHGCFPAKNDYLSWGV